MSAPTTTVRIQNYLHEQTRMVRAVEVAEALGINKKNIHRALRRLVDKGLVRTKMRRVPWVWAASPAKHTRRVRVYEILTES